MEEVVKMGKFGFSFSLSRLLGISSAKNRIARQTGIPTTRSGIERKIGRTVIKSILSIFGGK
jgi:hypothetical protein